MAVLDHMGQLAALSGCASNEAVPIADRLGAALQANDGLFAEIERLRNELDGTRENYPDAVWISPGRLGGKPCIGGHRIAVDTITRAMDGSTVAAVQAFYPQLSRAQILIACWYAAFHGDMGQWEAWAREHGGAMWSGRWDDVPEPTNVELCSDKNGIHDGHDWRADPCEGLRWCPGYPVPKQVAP